MLQQQQLAMQQQRLAGAMQQQANIMQLQQQQIMAAAAAGGMQQLAYPGGSAAGGLPGQVMQVCYFPSQLEIARSRVPSRFGLPRSRAHLYCAIYGAQRTTLYRAVNWFHSCCAMLSGAAT